MNAKIAILSSLYPPFNVGGTEKAVALLAETLALRGHSVIVISLHPGPDESVEEKNNVKVYRLPLDNLYMPWLGGPRPPPWKRLLWHIRDRWNRHAAERVAAILERERPAVLHTNSVSGFSVAVWSAARRLKIPVVHTLHDYYVLCTRTTLYTQGKVCEKRCLDCALLTGNRRGASRQVNAVAGVSEAVLDRHLRNGYFPRSALAVIPNIQPYSDACPQAKHAKLTFGFIGRVTREKGIELLLEALSSVPGLDCELKIAGSSEEGYREELQQRFPDPRVEWLGYTLAETFYALVDVVVIPSVWAEPLGYTCIESLYAGKNVIAADTGGLREIAPLAPLHQLFPAGSRDALADALRKAMDEKTAWQQPHRPGDDVLCRFSGQSVLEAYEKLYADAINRT